MEDTNFLRRLSHLMFIFIYFLWVISYRSFLFLKWTNNISFFISFVFFFFQKSHIVFRPHAQKSDHFCCNAYYHGSRIWNWWPQMWLQPHHFRILWYVKWEKPLKIYYLRTFSWLSSIPIQVLAPKEMAPDQLKQPKWFWIICFTLRQR